MSGIGSQRYDTIIIGSGFGGCLSALPLVEAGDRVLMLERGSWVARGPQNWEDGGAFVQTEHYSYESGHLLQGRFGARRQGLCTCVGGPSVFYGGASFRFRTADFEPAPEIVTDSRAAWPFSYEELEPYYSRAEEVLGIAGESGADPTEPLRSRPFPHPPLALADTSRLIQESAQSLGLRPFRIPTAIDGAQCRSCTTCDAFACAVEAKNDLATRILPALIRAGLELQTGIAVTRLRRKGQRVTEVEGVVRSTGARLTFRGDRVILAAGALASPHLLLASELDECNPAGPVIGRYLMRHCNAMVYGYFRSPPNPLDRHHKQIAIHDFYFGDPRLPAFGKLGNIQQVMAPPVTLIRSMLPKTLAPVATALVANLTGLLVIAEDQPRAENRVMLSGRSRDRAGIPGAVIRHRYTRRDLSARRALVGRAREILRHAGALFPITYQVRTFSHAVGTVRMGESERDAPLDPWGRFRGLENLWVTDGSVFPTSAGVNPSLTIAANALRVGTALARGGR